MSNAQCTVYTDTVDDNIIIALPHIVTAIVVALLIMLLKAIAKSNVNIFARKSNTIAIVGRTITLEKAIKKISKELIKKSSRDD